MQKVILAGGGWTRLRPVSTEALPKQFISIFSSTSLLQDTFERLAKIDDRRDTIYFSTHQKYEDKIIQQIWCDVSQLILEPERKNTAPAIALVVKYLEDVIGCSEDEIILISPADHIISPQEKFSATILSWVDAAQQGNIVLFGVAPTSPEIGYGYIKYDPSMWWSIFPVDEFTEKPNLETAQQYLTSGQYLWNAGIFMFTLKTIKQAFATHCPDIFQMMQSPYSVFVHQFTTLQSISFDYAVMEKAANVVVSPMNLMWSDIWSWNAIYQLLVEQKVANMNPYLFLDDKNNLVFGKQKIIVDGIENTFVIMSEDGLYIAKKWNSQTLRRKN